MKNLLIATTALVATAGVAAADVKLSGYARFGAVYNDAAAPGADEINTASRLRLQFDATTETDGGLTLGARLRVQAEEESAANNTGRFNTARFFASAGGLTIAMGNILGVIEAAPNLYLPTKSAGMGLEGNGFASLAANTYANGGAFGWTAYQSASANGTTDGVEVLYSMNGIGLHAHSTDTSYGLGANYKFADYTVAVAYEEWNEGARDGDSILFASIGGKFGAFDAALSYADTEYGGVDSEKVSLRGGYTVNDALYVYGFVADEDTVDTAYGLGASYGLGGGASVEGGWTSNQNGDNIVSAGIFFSF
ncbi:MAG: porin [Paracoccaceae bacterium]|jgi:outer membrane protein OmpU